jgi:hypothetical protein
MRNLMKRLHLIILLRELLKENGIRLMNLAIEFRESLGALSFAKSFYPRAMNLR